MKFGNGARTMSGGWILPALVLLSAGCVPCNVTVGDGVTVSGLYATDNRLDGTAFTCRLSGERLHFSFLLEDATPCAPDARGLPERTLELYDRVEVFLSPAADMSRPYCCIEIGLAGDVLDYRGVFYRQMDYAFALKTLEVEAGGTGNRRTVRFSVAARELEAAGIRPELFYLGVFRADFAPGGRLVDWYSAMRHGPGEADFHRPCHLFAASLR